MFGAFQSSKDNKSMFKIAFKQMFDNFNVNIRKKERFLTYIPCIPIPEYGQSNAPLVISFSLAIFSKSGLPSSSHF